MSRAPFTCLSPATLQELKRARLLFRAAKDVCPRASQVLVSIFFSSLSIEQLTTVQPILETMIEKAMDIYNRWMNGQELPIIVLRHITDDGSTEVEDFERRSPSQPADDPFMHTHQSLAQCIAEVHQIAKTLFPLRKPCNCANRGNSKSSAASPASAVNVGVGKVSHGLQQVAIAETCPPSHDWSPPPIVNASSAVLPDTTPLGLYGVGHGVTVGYPTYGGADANAYSTLQGSSPGGVGGMYIENGTGQYNGYLSGNTVAASAGIYGSNDNVHPMTTGYSNGPSSSAFRATTTSGGVSHCSPGNSGNPSGNGLYSSSVAVLPTSRPPVKLPPLTSKIGVVDTINFELGALSANNNQSFMAFY